MSASIFILAQSDGSPWILISAVILIGVGICALAAWLIRNEAVYEWAARLSGNSGRAYRWRRRRRLLRTPFPQQWREYLHNNIPIYEALTPAEQKKLLDEIRIFIAEKIWEGCRGLELTEEMKVTIAAQACILLLGLHFDYYDNVSTILVYPTAFQTPESHVGEVGLIEENIPVLGQAQYRGPVVLAWDQALENSRNPGRGRNVVYHEFAHQLDFLGEFAGEDSPARKRRRWNRWVKVMKRAYDLLLRDLEHGTPTLIDPYGATNEAEFFAVATECFFEQPAQLQDRHPDLFMALRDFYRQDPTPRMARLQVQQASAGYQAQ